MKPLAPSEFRDAVLTLDLTWSGRVFRFASEDVDIVDDSGATHSYAGGLALSWSETSELMTNGPSETIDIGAVVFPVDPSLWHAQGRDLIDAPGVLSLWAPGRTLEDRHVLMAGTVEASEYGEDGEPVSLTMRPPSTDDGALIPPPEAAVSTDTWSAPSTTDVGRPYPIVVGKPGLGGGVVTARGGSPAYCVSTAGNGKWLISYGRVAASTVTLVDIANGTSASLPVTVEKDTLGNVVSTVAGSGAGVTATDSQYAVDWSASDGGIIPPFQTTAAIGAGDVCLWLLSESTADYDEGAWRAVRRSLNRYKLSFYIESTSPLEVLRSEVLPLLPVSEISGPSGITPILWRWDATALDAEAVLEEGRNVHRASSVQLDRDGLVNEVTINYAPRSDDNQPYRSRTITGRNVGASTPNVFEHPACRASRNRYGQRSETFDTPNVYDTATADRTLLDIAAARALPRKRISYDGDADLGYLKRGSVVLLTDARLNLAERIALVVGRALSGSTVTLSLVLVSVPERDARPAS